MKKPRLILIFFGPPGSGKGTQTDRLGAELKLPVISTGELLRHEESLKSALGVKARRYIKKGDLVPDELIHAMMAGRLAKKDTAKGFILDGYPRDQHQLYDLLQLTKDDNIWLIEIKVKDREVLNRISGRRICDNCGASYHLVYSPPKKPGICDACGKKITIREDDKPAVVHERLAQYKATAKPLGSFGRKIRHLIIINGEQSINKVYKDILKQIRNL